MLVGQPPEVKANLPTHVGAVVAVGAVVVGEFGFVSRRFVTAWVVGLGVALPGVGAVRLPVFAIALPVVAFAFFGIGAGVLAFAPSGGANNSFSAGNQAAGSGHLRAGVEPPGCPSQRAGASLRQSRGRLQAVTAGLDGKATLLT